MAEQTLSNSSVQGSLQRGSNMPTHPLYQDRLPDWQQMEDTYAGERAVKQRGLAYLPSTAGQRDRGMASSTDEGWLQYAAYRERAIYHDIINEAVQAMVGIMHRKPASIKVPKKLEDMLKRCTPDGEDVQSLLRRINEQQLVKARIGLLLEVPDGRPVNETTPFIVTYPAANVVNWDVGVTTEQGTRRIELVALDESEYERTGMFNWTWVNKCRLLLSGVEMLEADPSQEARSGYVVASLRDGRYEPTAADFEAPSVGGRTLAQVSFTFVNANDIAPEPEAPPLIGMSNLALAIYRGEADYRHTLFMQGQETLVTKGLKDDQNPKIGAGAHIRLPADPGADAKFIGISAQGLAEQRQAIEGLLKKAAERGTKLLDFDEGGSAASGESLRIRVASRTTTLVSIAKTSAEGLKQQLRYAAEWVGADPDEVEVDANTDFADQSLTGRELLEWTQAKMMGAPISRRTIHTMMRKRDATDFDTMEEEDAEIEAEPKPDLGTGVEGGLEDDGGDE